MGGHRLARPITLGLRRQRVGPTQEAFGIGHARAGIGPLDRAGDGSRPALEVPVEEPGQRGHPTLVDRGQRRHHGGDTEPGYVAVPRRGQLGTQLGVRLSRTRSPGAAGVVTELVRLGRQDAMGHPAARHDLTFFVHSQGLHRCGADVDAYRDRPSPVAHQSEIRVMMPPLWTKVRVPRGARRNEHCPAESSGHRCGERTRARPAPPVGRSRARFVARSTTTAHLQRAAIGRPGGRRGGQPGRGRKRYVWRRAVRATDHRGGQLPGRSHQRRRPRRHGRRRPGAAGPGTERRRGGRARRRPSLRGHAGTDPGRPRRAGRRDLSGREDPLPALPVLGAGRQDRGSGRSGRGGTGAALAPAGPGSRCAGLRPLRPRCHQLAPASCWSDPTWSRCMPRSPRRRSG